MSRPGPDPAKDDLVSADVSKELRREFLLQAGLLNLGVLTGGTGLVLLLFTDRTVGGVLLGGLGVCLLGLARWRYHREAPSN